LFCLAFVLAAVLAAATSDTGQRNVDLRYDVYVGDETHPVNTGVVWLLRYSWNGPVWVQVGAILEGRATIAFDSGVMPRLTHYDARYDDHYVIAFELPDAQWYVSRSIDSKRFFSDLPNAIETIGTVTEGARGAPSALGLSQSVTRTITLTNEDGTPAKNVALSVNVRVSNQDHCGVEQGPEIGSFETDQAGNLTLHAPPEPLFIGVDFYSSVGGRFTRESGIVVGADRDIVIRRTWRIAPKVVALKIVDAAGRPEAGRVIESQRRASTCGPHFGPVGTTDSHGVATMSLRPLEVDRMWVDLPGPRRRTLTAAEQKQLFTSGSVTIHVRADGLDSVGRP
jgi:hypothetical protein